MGWPRKNADVRLYYERKSKTYMLVDFGLRNCFGNYEYVGEVMTYNNPEVPKLGTGSTCPQYLHNHCRRAQWDEMPEVWRRALANTLNAPPEMYRGLWRIGQQPAKEI